MPPANTGYISHDNHFHFSLNNFGFNIPAHKHMIAKNALFEVLEFQKF